MAGKLLKKKQRKAPRLTVGTVKTGGANQTLVAPYHEVYITAQCECIIGKTGSPVQDLWMDVTNLVPQLQPDLGTMTVLPDIRRLKVSARTPYGNDVEGAIAINAYLYATEGTIIDEEEKTRVNSLYRKLDPTGTMPRALNEDIVSGVSVLKNVNVDLNTKDFTVSGLIFDQTFGTGNAKPVIRVVSAGDAQSTRFYCHVGKYMLNTTSLAAAKETPVDLNIEIWYRRFTQETVDSGIFTIPSNSTFTPAFAKPAKLQEINAIRDVRSRAAARLAYDRGLDVILDPRFSWTKLWQTIVGVVKTAAPIISGIAGVLKEDPRQLSSVRASLGSRPQASITIRE